MAGKPEVLVTRRLPAVCLRRIEERCAVTLYQGEGAMPRDRLLAEVAGKAGAVTLLTDRVDGEFLDAAGDGLLIVANYAVGFDNVDLPACTSRGVLASNTPDVLTETTADFAWALLMAAARRVAEGDRFLRAETPWIWGPEMMLGRDVHGATLGVVGFGRIGQAVARRAAGFGMKVVYNDAQRPPPETEGELGAEYKELDDLLAEADLITLHTSLTPETRHLIDAARLRRMKPTAVIVNTSRGPIIDEEALAAALESGQIFAAGLDVFENEPAVNPRLLRAPNAVLAPHLGSAAVAAREAMGMVAADNLFAALDGERPPTLVNPEAWDSRRTPGVDPPP